MIYLKKIYSIPTLIHFEFEKRKDGALFWDSLPFSKPTDKLHLFLFVVVWTIFWEISFLQSRRGVRLWCPESNKVISWQYYPVIWRMLRLFGAPNSLQHPFVYHSLSILSNIAKLCCNMLDSMKCDPNFVSQDCILIHSASPSWN